MLKKAKYQITLFLLIGIACSTSKKSLTSSNQIKLNKTVDSLYVLDQKHRLNLIALDSIYEVNWRGKGAPLTSDEIFEKLGNNYETYKQKQDSIWKVIKEVDNSNTEYLIALTKKYGFPSKKRLNAYRASAYLIFVHAAQKYYPELKTLISQEYKENRISEYEMAYIFWHLNGRNGMPPRGRKDGSVLYDTKIKKVR